MRRFPVGWGIGAVVLVALLVLPFLVGDAGLLLPTEVLIFAVFALTYDLVFGYTGLISFGHALFVGGGAYAFASALSTYHAPLWLAFVVALVAGIVLSVATGVLALRTRGVYFAMVTLAFAQAAYTLAGSGVGNLGGENGLPVNGLPASLVGPGSQTHIYYIALTCLVAAFLLLRLFVLSPAGRVWQAVRDNERRASMIGYRPYAYKLLAYVISGAVCSVAGAVYAISIGTVSTGLFSADTTIQLLLMVIIGGAGSLWGAILGAALIRYLNYYLNLLPGSSLMAHMPTWAQQTLGQPLLLFGIIYLLLVFFFPQGIAGVARRLGHLHAGRAVEDSSVAGPGLAGLEGEAVQPNVGESGDPQLYAGRSDLSAGEPATLESGSTGT